MQARHEEINLDTPWRIRLSNSNDNNNRQTYFVSSHWHEYIELIYVIEGKLEICTNSKKNICCNGDLFIINSCEAHTTKFHDKPHTQFYVIQFDPSIISVSNIMYQMKYVLPFIKCTNHRKQHFLKNDLTNTNIPSLVENLFYEYTEKNYAYELAVQSKIIDLFLFIIRIWHISNSIPANEFDKNPEDMKMIKIAMHFANEHLHEPITVSEVAKHCNLSYTYFSSKFKKLCGKTFKQYLQFIRLKEAEKLLVTTKLSVTEIACQTGFNDASYFIFIFKKSKKHSPGKFRKQFRQ